MNAEVENQFEILNKKIDFILDVINLAEINGYLPKELIERSRNRMKIEHLREQLKTEKNENLDKTLKKYIEKEIEFENYFKKNKKKNFISSLVLKLLGKV